MWTKTRLKFLASEPIRNGLGEAGAFEEPNWPRYIRTTDIASTRELRSDVFKSLPPDTAKRALLCPGDILMTAAGATIGKSYLHLKSGSYCFAGYLVRFRAAGNVDPRFISYWTESEIYLNQIATGAVRSTIDNFSASKYGNLILSVPSVEEQRGISDFLDGETSRIDSLMRATERQVHLLDERCVEVFREATTTGGRTETRATGIRWMPCVASDYSLYKVGLAFGTGSGTTPRSSDPSYFDGNYYWINTGDLRDSPIASPSKTVTDRALKDYSTLKIYDPGALVVAMYGATTGRVGILKVPACVNQACCVLVGLGDVSINYSFYWFRGHRAEILALASGGGQPNISQDVIRGLRIPAPKKGEQRRIVQLCDELEEWTVRQQGLLHRRRHLLDERRRALITAAVTGQFDVSSASGRGVTDGVGS